MDKDDTAPPPLVVERKQENNVIAPSFVSRLLFFFVAPVIKKARKNGHLNIDDIPLHTNELGTAELSKTFADARHAQPKEKQSLARALVAGKQRTLVLTGVAYILAQGCSLAGPLLLGEIVSGLTCRNIPADVPGVSCVSQTTLYLYALGLFAAPLLQAFIENNNTYVLNVLGVNFRNKLMGAIFRKCLRLNNSSLATVTTGKIVTLMSNDAQKVQDVTLQIHTIWGSPVFIVVVMVLLYLQIQWACFVGLAVMFLLGPITGYVGKNLGALRRRIVKWTDARTSIMSEVVNGMRVIKFYAWEQPFKEQVGVFRNEEAKILRTIAKLQGAFGLTLFAGPIFVGIASFAAYALAGNELTASKAYTSLALFTLLRFPMGFLPAFILAVVNARVALQRIGTFLDNEEVSEDDALFITDVPPGTVNVANGSFKWEDDEESPVTLRDINLSCSPGSLTMIVGAVGSGKSSMLATLFRQIKCVEGAVAVGGRVAYVPQTAWIMNETVRENVLMGSAMDETRYKHALTAAQLATDLELFGDGDLTEIGERGVTLSGGQKQRVSIARAIYADADVVILDDPLSAVDAHVGKALFEDAITGALRGKTIILVTNALHFLHHADQVAWMYEGELRRVGSYADVSRDPAFAELVGNHVIPEEASAGGEGGKEAVKGGKAAVGAAMNVKLGNEKNLTGNEDRMSGAVGGSIIWKYALAGGGVIWLIGIALAYLFEQGSKILTDRWLGFWTADRFDQPLGFYLGVYGALAVAFGLITYLRSITVVFGTVRAAVNLHNELLDRIMRLPVTFFDTNPSGRIINRFSRDTDIMDSVLPTSLVQFAACVSSYIGILVVISIATPWFVLMLPPITVIYFFLQRFYIPAAREMQRLEAVTRSPIYSGFSEAVNGITTIRAYRKEAHFTRLEDRLIDANGLVFITQRAGAAWLSIRLDFIGLTVLTAAGLLAVASDIDPGLAGLSLTYALDLTKFLKFGTQMASKTESDFNSVERVAQYLAEAEEAPAVLEGDPPAATWPAAGEVAVTGVVMRYRPELPTVLKGVTFHVEGGASVGVVGRTGSGKSSLFLAFFRMVNYEAGSIVIDGVDVATLGLATLRQGLSMIPQDPFMFSGTVRRNLDPFDRYADGDVWLALENVGLKPTIAAMDDKLEAKVSDNGGNFSQGQRQLFCLARALLRNSKILMLDEATASVDLDTDALIQRTVRTSFKHCTVLTIAHRLNTIMDAEKVLVMDAGRAAEYDTPQALLKDPDTLFSRLVENTGKQSSKLLRSIASTSHMRRPTSLQEMVVVEEEADSRPSSEVPSVGGQPELPEATMPPEAGVHAAPDVDLSVALVVDVEDRYSTFNAVFSPHATPRADAEEHGAVEGQAGQVGSTGDGAGEREWGS